MAKPDLLTLGLLAGGGVFLYKWWQDKELEDQALALAEGAATPPPAPPLGGGGPGPVIASPTSPGSTQPGPAVGAPPAPPPVASPPLVVPRAPSAPPANPNHVLAQVVARGGLGKRNPWQWNWYYRQVTGFPEPAGVDVFRAWPSVVGTAAMEANLVTAAEWWQKLQAQGGSLGCVAPVYALGCACDSGGRRFFRTGYAS